MDSSFFSALFVCVKIFYLLLTYLCLLEYRSAFTSTCHTVASLQIHQPLTVAMMGTPTTADGAMYQICNVLVCGYSIAQQLVNALLEVFHPISGTFFIMGPIQQ